MFTIIIYLFIISNLSLIQSKHFLGGTISWKVIDNDITNSSIPVIFTQSYQWTETATYCNQSYIVPPSGSSIPSVLACVNTTNSSCGGYTSLNALGHCVDSSNVFNSRTSQILDTENIAIGSKFCVAFQNMNWMVLQSPFCNNNCSLNSAKWSIGSCIDLTPRSDGSINTSPVATVVSPVLVPINSLINIKIPVLDADNDITRCRWAKKTSKLDECGDVCGTILGSTLSSSTCTLTFNSTGKTVGIVYAAALMVEDFANASTNTSLSSVPIQFLIQIVGESLCSLKPTISLNLSDCMAIQVGIQFNFTVTIVQGCSNTSISELVTVSPLYMYKSNMTRVGSSDMWTVTQTWIPTNQQIGSQVYCAVAIDSANITSDQYCTTFTVVGTNQSLLCPGETTTSTLSTTSSINQSNDDYRLLALGLGLGLPLLLLLSGLILYYCCCCKPYNLYSARIRRRILNRNQSADNYRWNERFIDHTKENKDFRNQLPDYREQYINNGSSSRNSNPFKFQNEYHRLANENSFQSTPSGGFELNSMNILKTSYFTPSISSLPTDEVQRSRNNTFESTDSANQSSILVHAYAVQTKQKSIYTS
ncbi:unnamed protein product [Adineta steineri]|uniref:Uncharacterized protein n=1 Tax=Adineta steineri TaxID=433720 RepID=A0A813NRT0_9BILA|nr:unnamed protein product [Adineta steineri]